MKRSLTIAAALTVAVLCPSPVRAQIVARVPAGTASPAWDNGIQPINRDSYWNAVECGKKGGERPLCVFSDTDLCTNDDFVLALFTPYKQVAYEVWQAVRRKQDPPTPSFQDAQRTRVTIGVTPAKGSRNTIAGVTITRGDKTVTSATPTLDAGGGRFIFDPAVFAPTDAITLELTGKSRTLKCVIDEAVLRFLR